MLSKSQLRALSILSEPMRSKDIAAALGITPAACSYLVHGLEEYGFVERSGGRVCWSSYPHAIELRQLLGREPGMDYTFLKGKALPVLLAILERPKTPLEISREIGGSGNYIRNVAYSLRLRGVVCIEGRAAAPNLKAWNGLYAFLRKLSEFLEAKERQLTFYAGPSAVPTGFSLYPRYGVLMYPKSTLYYRGKDKLDKETVFVHSLAEVEDTRTTKLALEFMKKNRLDMGKVQLLAEKLRLSSKLAELVGG